MVIEITKRGMSMKNIFAILGFIILLGIGIWSAVQVITFIPRLFSDSGVSSSIPANTIELGDRDIIAVLGSRSVRSGELMTIRFAHRGDESGVLSFSYACTEDFYFETAGQHIVCNEPYNLNIAATSLEVTPVSTRTSVEVPLAITYTNTDGESVRDTHALFVTNDTLTTDVIPIATETIEQQSSETETNTVTIQNGPREPEPVVSVPAPTSFPTKSTYATSNPYGMPDLQVVIHAVGEINAYGMFEAKGYVRPYARGAAKFRVTNLGDKSTGTWYFSAVLPTLGGYLYNSEPQVTLPPGASIDVLITFDQMLPGARSFSVHVDPYNAISERNEYNNIAGQPMTVLGY